jgi:hypothetical protein
MKRSFVGFHAGLLSKAICSPFFLYVILSVFDGQCSLYRSDISYFHLLAFAMHPLGRFLELIIDTGRCKVKIH